MRQWIIAAATLVALMGCVSHAPNAEKIRITKQGADVAGCTVVGEVHSTPPYVLPNEDYIQMRNAALALDADTVFVTSRLVVSRGIAYRCH